MVDINIIESIEEASEIRIAVVGVGGGGCNAITNIYNHRAYSSVKLIASNTDAQHLRNIKADIKIQIGEKICGGKGAGMSPEIGMKAAEESYEQIKGELKGFDIIFIAVGLGGGTGTGAAPIFARIARELGATSIAIATKPFITEGNRRASIAEEGFRNLKDEVNCIIVIPNEKVLSMIDQKVGIKTAFGLIDNVLEDAVHGIASFILNESDSGINADYSDLQRIASFKGLSIIGCDEEDSDDEGEDNSALKAVRTAIESPLFDNLSIKGAKGVIVYFEINEDYPMHNINEAMQLVNSSVAGDPDLKMGISYNSDFPPTKAKVIVIATGFEQEILPTQKEIHKVKTQGILKVSGSLTDDILHSSDDLDYPSFYRKQKD